ncbi:MAG: hypothetical protein F7C35_02810 [Desulfurococcales archaeon]|nr:hypothetical protein [Desulfurococcales archaeon]
MKKCSVCGRRQAVYKRTYSGELLCKTCLERAVIKGVRRSLAEAHALRPMMKLLLPLTFSNPLGSLVLASVLPKVERQYNGRVTLALPQSLSTDVDEEVLTRSGLDVVHVKLEPERPPSRDPIECWRFDRRWALRTAFQLSQDAIILPLTRTDLNLLLIHTILSGRPEGLSEALPSITWTKPPIISGLSKLEGEIVAAYSAINKINPPQGCNPDLWASKELVYSVARRRPELEFSSHKSLTLLLEGLTRSLHPRHCRMCGGFTVGNGDVCQYCSKLDLNAYLVTR